MIIELIKVAGMNFLCSRDPNNDLMKRLDVLTQVLCEDKSVEDVLHRHFDSSKDFGSMHTLLVRLFLAAAAAAAPPLPVLRSDSGLSSSADVVSQSRLCVQTGHQTGGRAGGQQAVFRRRQGQHAAR